MPHSQSWVKALDYGSLVWDSFSPHRLHRSIFKCGAGVPMLLGGSPHSFFTRPLWHTAIPAINPTRPRASKLAGGTACHPNKPALRRHSGVVFCGRSTPETVQVAFGLDPPIPLATCSCRCFRHGVGLCCTLPADVPIFEPNHTKTETGP